MFYKIEVFDRPGVFDAVGSGIKKDILDLGVKTVRDVRFAQAYLIDGDISQSQVKIDLRRTPRR
ncbi:MAG: phosphoribosylformylglycinamidine synthase subunit PurS [Candidatus Omnitrophica bacterium]|nr:phosphoribosylformylglycinamidine synthase subunit PurS [Candidatus Omnitrophota bacterium]